MERIFTPIKDVFYANYEAGVLGFINKIMNSWNLKYIFFCYLTIINIFQLNTIYFWLYNLQANRFHLDL